jgi:hypothetical protein
VQVNIQRSIQLTDKAVRTYWLRGLARTMIQSGATAVTTFLGMAGANAVGVQVPTLDLRGVAVVFVSQAIVAAFNYLKEHPLPDQEEIPEHIEQAMADKEQP